MLSYLWAKLLKKIRGSAIRNSDIHFTSKVESGSHVVNSTFGRHSFCGYDCEIINCDVGSFCSISDSVVIGRGMHPIKRVSTSPVFYKGRDSVREKFAEHERPKHKKTVIGHDVWIGQNVMIKQGVEINTGSVIGMGSVVTKDVPPYAIVGGVPAKIIKYRFEKDIIEALLASKWWSLSDSELKVHSSTFKEPAEFLKKISN